MAKSKDKLFEAFGLEAAQGSVLFHQGQPGGSLYVIREGSVRLSKLVYGHKRVLEELGPGEFFGELAILDQRNRVATAEVTQDAKLLKLPSAQLEEMVRSEPEIAVRMIKKIAQRLANTQQLVDVVMQDDPHARVISWIDQALRDAERDAQGYARVIWDEELVAGQLGLQASDVNHALARLARVGLVEREGHFMKVLSPARLRDFLHFVKSGEGEEGSHAV